MIGNDNNPWLPVPRRLPFEQHRKNTLQNILPSPLVSLALANTCPLIETSYREEATSSARMRKDASRLDRCDVAYWHETDLPRCPQFGRYRGKADMAVTSADFRV